MTPQPLLITTGENPRGRDDEPVRERMVELQRARMFAGMVGACADCGVGDVTVARVVERAGVSRRTFYEIFDSCEDCYLAAFEDIVGQVATVVLPAYCDRERWREKIAAALTALLELFDEQPDSARLLVVDSLRAGPNALERRRLVLAHAIVAIDEGRREEKGACDVSALTAEGVVGAVLAILHSRLLEPEPPHLLELLAPLMGMIVLPYLGRGAARRELERAWPKRPEAALPHAGDALRTLDMRLTYRTVRVLLSLAAQPGSSNREVALASGVTDQGQISKLLARLERLGLVSNGGLAPGKGAPNAWQLTEKGKRIEHAISTEATRSDTLSGRTPA
jgi:AcrR family transcriptional regulator